MYRVEYFCHREGGTWKPVPDNPFWILSNAISRVNALIFQYASARVVDSAGNVLYSA